jgi:hypothetical protein
MRSVLLVVLALVLAAPAGAATDRFGPGSLDASFGKLGLARSALGLYEARSADIGTDARGRVYALASGAVVGRFRPNGTLDRSYGHIGRARVAFRAGWDGNTYAAAMDVEPNGLVTVVGATRFNTLWVARFGPDGQPDDEFGDAGVVQVSEDA